MVKFTKRGFFFFFFLAECNIPDYTTLEKSRVNEYRGGVILYIKASLNTILFIKTHYYKRRCSIYIIKK